jgi:hypothetical protein
LSDAPAESYAVVLGGKEGLLPDVLARVLAAFRGVTVLDAAMAVRRARGILAERLDRAAAEDLAGRLRAEGIAAASVPASVLAELPPALLLSKAAPGPTGLRVVVRGEGERLVPWDRLRLAAVAPFKETVYRKVTSNEGPSGQQVAMSVGITAITGMPVRLGAGKKQERSVPKSEFHLFLDLLLEYPAERLRVDAGRFDFSGLGDLMTYAGLTNTRTLLSACLAAAPRACRSPGADLLLTGGQLSSLGYESLADFEREERWLLTVVP